MKDRLLRVFNRSRRPRSWVIFGIGVVGLVATISGQIPKGLSALDDQAVGWFIVMVEGMGNVEEAEESEDAPGTPDDTERAAP